MPRGDGTGPFGTGPATGRGAGYCTGYGTPGYAGPWRGKGYFCWGGDFGRGRVPGTGRGSRWQHWYNAKGQSFRTRGGQPLWNRPPGFGTPYGGGFPDKETEADFLKREVSALEEELNRMKARIENLEQDS